MSAPPGAATPLLEAGRFGRFEIVLSERRLQADGQTVALGSRAFDLLAALVTRRDRIVPKDELIDVVWPGLVVEDNNLQVQISALRKVLGAQAIATVPGRGYQFTIAAHATVSTTPAVDPKPSRPAERKSAGAQRKSRLLVADDNKVNRLLLCRSIELMGHEVASVDNGRAALAALRAEPFDMLLLDLEMPELDGFGLLELRAGDPSLLDVPVIVTSSLEGAAQVARCIELGADDYLHKPVNPVLLKARVGASLERKHLRDRERELLARIAPDLDDGASASVDGSSGRRGNATLLVARLRDIAALAASQPAQDTLELLSNWATLMLDTLEERGGLVHQITGDGIAAVFGARASSADAAAPAAAVQAARDMQALAAQFNAERVASGKVPIALGIGIASGEMVSGHAGTARRASYACVGAAAQRAVRLEALAAEKALPVVLDAATRAALPDGAKVEALPPMALPGSAEAVSAFALKTV